MITIDSYRDLRVWQLAMDFCVKTYQVSARFPNSEIYGLTAQIRRASVSIPSNIAEGHRRSKDEIDTVIDVALQAQARASHGHPTMPAARQGAGAALLLQQHPHPLQLRGWAWRNWAATPRSSTPTRPRSATATPAKEIGEIYGRYYDGIAIRQCDWGVGNKYINEVAKASRVPVLNMQCDVYHPFQILADLMTIIEKKGDPRGKTINVSWAYASSYQKPISRAAELILQMTRFGMNVRLTRIRRSTS
jgi:hypothetical protein